MREVDGTEDLEIVDQDSYYQDNQQDNSNFVSQNIGYNSNSAYNDSHNVTALPATSAPTIFTVKQLGNIA